MKNRRNEKIKGRTHKSFTPCCHNESAQGGVVRVFGEDENRKISQCEDSSGVSQDRLLIGDSWSVERAERERKRVVVVKNIKLKPNYIAIKCFYHL